MRQHSFVDWSTQAYLLLVAALIAIFHNETVPDWQWLVSTHLAAVLTIEGLIRLEPRLGRFRVLSFLRHFYPVLLYAGLYAEIGRIDRMFCPQFLDRGVAGWDQRLFGCQPSLELMQHLPYLWVSEAFYASYFSYYVMIGGVGIALFVKDRNQFFHYVSVVSFVFYVCYLLYLFLPVAGPLFLFVPIQGYTFPADLLQVAQNYPYPGLVQTGPFYKLMAWLYRSFDLPGATLPSSHVAVALCTVFFSFRYLRPIRFLHLTVALVLCVATVYCRYHYAVDVITGVLTAAVLVPLGNCLYFKLSSPQWPSGKGDRSYTAERPLLREGGAS